MCLIALAWQAHPRFELVVVANRDEWHARPSAAAAPWDDLPPVLGGRDLQAGGSWLAFSPQGRFAAVTNVRDGRFDAAARPRSRGELVAGFLRESATWPEHSARLAEDCADYGPFNLLAWDGCRLGWAGNHPDWRSTTVAPGVHGLSNAALDTPWPKTRRAVALLERWLDVATDPGAGTDVLLDAFAERTPAHDQELPDTGVGRERERLLSPLFIAGERYGTRCTTVLLVGRDGDWRFIERRYAAAGVVTGESHWPADAM